MLKAFKKLWNDERGNALIIAGAALPLLVGSVGLGTDTVQWALWKRQLQRAADSAALAGVYARFQDASSSSAVTTDLTTNKHLWVPLSGGYPQVTEPAVSSPYSKAVQVVLAVQQPLSFSSMFMSASPTITATARAAGIDDGEFCLIAKEDTNESGITIGGNAQVNLGCGMISNSVNASISVDVNGNSHSVTADPIAGVGGVPPVNGTNTEQSYHLAQPDPYENLYDTSVPPGTPCENMNQHEVNESPNDPNVTTLSPGCYSGNNQFKFTGGDYVLQPGTYYLNNADFDVSGNTNISCSGCTIILTGNSPGQVKLNGNGALVLTAPTTGTFAKMLLIQSASASNSDGNVINGNSSSSIDGTVYFPNQGLSFTGTGGATTKCAMVVARRVDFSGTTNIQNNTTGCTANSKVKGKIVRLIG